MCIQDNYKCIKNILSGLNMAYQQQSFILRLTFYPLETFLSVTKLSVVVYTSYLHLQDIAYV
jgi:hypothetical protein